MKIHSKPAQRSPLAPLGGKLSAVLAAASLGTSGQAVEESDAFNDLLHGSPGFYPTGQEAGMLGGTSREMYGRHSGGQSIGGPDAGSLTASGIWHQDPEPTESFYERHNEFFGGLDSFLGVLAPNDVVLWQSDPASREYLYGYADPGFLMTRDFNPDLASTKLGPFYLDFLRASTTVLYSDYNGTPVQPYDDGWLSVLSLDFRGAARLTQNLYLTTSGSVYFLPGEGELGFYLADGRASFFRLAYEGHINSWEYVVFDDFRISHRLSEIFDEVEHDEIERSGRYRFGRYDSLRSNDYFDRDGFIFRNRVGTAFTGPIGDDFRAAISLERIDTWQSLDFDNHNYWDRIRARLDYLGFDWPIVPYFEYELTAVSGWDRIYQSFWLGARARLTHNLRVDGRAGYFTSHGGRDDYDRPVAELGLVHDLGPNTSHSLFAGTRYHNWDDGEDLMASYLRYSIAHRFGSRLRGTAYVQLSDLDNLDGALRDRTGWSSGARLTMNLSDYTFCTAGVYYDEWDSDLTTVSDQRRWIYRATINQRLLPFLYGRFLFQYEDVESTGVRSFDERLYMFSLDYLF